MVHCVHTDRQTDTRLRNYYHGGIYQFKDKVQGRLELGIGLASTSNFMFIR